MPACTPPICMLKPSLVYTPMPRSRSGTQTMTWSMRVKLTLLRLDVGALHGFRHALEAGLGAPHVFLGRRADRVEAVGDELLAHVGGVDGLQRLGAQAIHDRLRGAERHDDRRPGAPLEVGHAGFGH